MPHIGPESSATTVDKWNFKEQMQTVLTGSASLDKLIKKYNEQIVCVLHGHTHDSSNYDFVKGVPICNPNAFYKGKYAMYVIEDGILQKKEFMSYL